MYDWRLDSFWKEGINVVMIKLSNNQIRRDKRAWHIFSSDWRDDEVYCNFCFRWWFSKVLRFEVELEKTSKDISLQSSKAVAVIKKKGLRVCEISFKSLCRCSKNWVRKWIGATMERKTRGQRKAIESHLIMRVRHVENLPTNTFGIGETLFEGVL